MEPQIRYAKTSDGINVAYWAIGEGTVLVQVPPIPFTQVQLAQAIPEDREWAESMFTERRLVRYDARGTGLSDRQVTNFSLEAHLADLQAVINDAVADRVVLWGQFTSGPIAIAYAARNPDRVSRLVLWSCWPRSRDVLQLPQARALLALIETDWELFTETSSHAFFGWATGETGHRAAAFMREGVSPEVAKAIVTAMSEFDVTGLLASVQAPTLVFHSREAPMPDIAAARTLVSGIPEAQLLVIEGTAAGWGTSEEALRVLDDFIGDGKSGSMVGRRTPPARSGTAVILFADIVDSTALTERLGDDAFRAKARELNVALRNLIRDSGGAPVEGPTLGDGLLATFASARQGIEAALSCASSGDQAGLPLHLGLHAGDVLREKDAGDRDNVYGGAVNVAARISGLAGAGEVLVSQTVRDLARTSAGVGFEDRGERELKGVGESVRVWAVLRQAQDERANGEG